jgi:U3 small nucleolar RNA-associated protein 15
MEAVFGTGHVKQKGANAPPVIGPSDEFKVESKRRQRLREFDRYLKGFKYSSALDAGLKQVRYMSFLCGSGKRE